MDPASCRGCHPSHFREWSGSMHAYAGEDPLFLAMNRRMQRLTNGALGDFCVRCHAPVALALGLTTDGLNLAELAPKLRGVTCFFCHASTPDPGTRDEFNNPRILKRDGVMRGGIANPVPNRAHEAAYALEHDREAPEGVSSAMCGPCHDIVTPSGTHIERTFQEWARSVYGRARDGETLSCGQCHMPGRRDLAAQAPGVLERRVHDHSMPAVDTALIPFPETQAQREGIQRLLDQSVLAALCVRPGAGGALSAEVSLRSVTVGHGLPSGSAQDRRVWVELVAYRGPDVVFSSGRFAPNEAVTPARDPELFELRDHLFRQDGSETPNFWEAARFESKQLPAPGFGADAKRDVFRRKSYPVPAGADRVTMAVHFRGIDVDFVEDLLATGDLTDRSLLDRLPTFTLAPTRLEWKAGGAECVAP